MAKHFTTRREFLRQTGGGLVTGGAAASTALTTEAPCPRRPLGRTGASVSCLAFGCGTRFLSYGEEEGERVLSQALGLGVDYLDTAAAYGDGESERRVGRFLQGRRQQVFLATKVPSRARTRDTALSEVEASLKRLGTDHVDLLHVHDLGDAVDLARIEAPGGVLEALYALRDQKVARAIGMTSHTDGTVMAQAIERHDLDCVQMALNAARVSAFEALALPAAGRKGLGVLAMKVMAQDKLLGGPGAAAPEELLRYVLSLPVAAAVVGMPRPEHLTRNAEVVRRFKPLSPAATEELARRVAPVKASLGLYFNRHRDGAWA
jgi:aryl-alcohol dehydrogenase-like predicted oxidoreductase